MRIRLPKRPQCPFCDLPLPKPEYVSIGLSDFEGGICECGAVFVVDVTGYRRGAAFLTALELACGGDTNLALDLIPEEDYQERWLENYDLEEHKIYPEPTSEGKTIRGALCFIKLTEDWEELKKGDRRKYKKKSVISPSYHLERFREKLNRKKAEEFLLKEDLESAIFYLIAEPYNLNVFQKILYHPEETMRKKAAFVLGKAASELSKIYPEKIHDFLKRLLYVSADTASSPWGALEAVGEIIAETGDRLAFFVKNLIAFLVFPEYRLSVLYALLRIAEKNKEALKKAPYLKLLNLFPKASLEEQALIIKIFTYLRTPELSSYEKVLKKGKVALFHYQNFIRHDVFIEELWENYTLSLS